MTLHRRWRVRALRTFTDQPAKDVIVTAVKRQGPDDTTRGVRAGGRGIPPYVALDVDDDTLTPAAAEKLGRILLAAAKFARAKG